MAADKEKNSATADKNQSATIHGDINNSTIVIAGGNVNFASQEPSIDELLKSAYLFLQNEDHDKTLEVCEKVLKQNPLHPEGNLYSAIALMRGSGADKLSPQKVAIVEARLEQATNNQATMLVSLAILGIVKYDYYVVNQLLEKDPTFDQIVKKIKQVDLKSVNLALVQKIRASKSAIKKLGLSQ